MWLVVGLGNPGKEYASHRHNVGFMAVDEIARAARGDSFKEKFSAEYARVSHAGEDAILLKPQTFMNLSGQSVQPAAAFFKVPVERILVLHDELDLPFGDVKLKVWRTRRPQRSALDDRAARLAWLRPRAHRHRPPARGLPRRGRRLCPLFVRLERAGRAARDPRSRHEGDARRHGSRPHCCDE